MSEQKFFKHESYQDREAIISYISEIIKGLEEKALHFADDNGEIFIQPEELMRLELKVKSKEEKTKISFKIEWKDGLKKKDVKETVTDNCLLIESKNE